MGPMKMKDTDRELFETKSVWAAVLSLAIPSVIGQLILVIYNMADTFFVGLAGDDSMLAAVTVCMPAFMFLSAISNLFGVGGSSVMGREMGKGRYDRAKLAFSFSVWGCLIVSALYCLFVFLFQDAFLNLLGGSDTSVHELADDYLLITVVIFGIPTALNTLFSHLIRAQGKSLMASTGVVIGGVLNIALDPLFMFVILPKGEAITGAAIATGLSNFIALLYYVAAFIFARKKVYFSLKIGKETFQNKLALNVVTIGIPACLMTLCENISYAILDSLMSQVSLPAQAGVGVAKKINMFAHSAVRGVAQGILPLIAYNKASGNRSRMKKAVYTGMGISLVLAGLSMVVNLIWARPITSIFIQNDESGSLSYGAAFLRIFCIGAPFSAIAYMIISFFQAVGCPYRSLLLALLRKGIVDIPLMFLLQYAIPIYGIVWATPIADATCCLVSIVLFAHYLKKHGHDKYGYAAKAKSQIH